ncbi:N-6 DNA methylase [Pseudomonas sp. ABC1]|uniref:N-6 DNA methylase n=1 Tax=Pseudomonas sp. ABC1 TaxID=2748080 RepID=UPI0015C31DFB|nr:N-6 DNA methylase [Pseudomonas sp. ABC1]QLF93654.1 N-6 DNA methylase [Pseudomonas sp. ABC1]
MRIPLYEGLESSYEDIVYQFLRRALEDKNHTIRVKRSGYPEIDTIVPSAASGKLGKGASDAYIFREASPSGLCGLIELESTGKLQAGIAQIRKYAAGFFEKSLSAAQKQTVNSITERNLKLFVFDGRSIYLSTFSLDSGKETILINGQSIDSSNEISLNNQLISLFPRASRKAKINEDELIKLTAKIIRGHEKLQRNKALLMTLLASIYGATNESTYHHALEAIKSSQFDYDVKLYQTYKDFLIEITEDNDKEKIKQLYEKVAIYLYDLSKDQGMDLYGFIYEELASKESKKEQGEYYTPRHTIRPVLKSVFENYLAWDASELNKKIVLDPFCGSGGFLYEYIEIIRKKFNLSDSLIDEIAGKSLWGFDKSNVLGAYLNLFLAGDGSANVYRVRTSINWRKYFVYKDEKNKLSRLNDTKAIKFHLKQNLADINRHLKMLAGVDVQISEHDIDEFIEHDSPVDAFAMKKAGLTSCNKDERYLGNVDLLITNVPYGSVTEKREQFIESGQPAYGASLESNALRECIDYLKPAVKKGKYIQHAGGVCIAIVPDSVLENPTDKPIRDYLISRCEILSIVSLPPFTFAPYAMEKTYVLIFQKLAPEDFGYYRELGECFMYDSICDGKANSVNRYKTDHVANFEINDYKGNKRIVEAYIHNDFDPFFESLEPSSYSYLSKLEWAWRKDFSNYNPNWDQERVSEVWDKGGWRVLPGKKWGYFPLKRFKQLIQKEIKSKTLYRKIHSYLESQGIDKQAFCDDYEFYRNKLIGDVELSAAEHEKLHAAQLALLDVEAESVTLYENQEIEDVDLNPASHRYLGVKKESYNFENHLELVLNRTYASLDRIIDEFCHDFSSAFMPVRLGTEFEVIQGTQFSKVDAYKNPGNVAVFTAATDGPAYFVSEKISGKVKVNGPSLIWSRKGAKAGTVQKYNEKDESGNYLPFFISDVSGTIKPKPEKVDSYDLDFLLVYFSGLLKNERTSNSNNAQVNKSKIENLMIFLPSLETQMKIGDLVRATGHR